MYKVGIIGYTGMVGQELMRMLEVHQGVTVSYRKNSSSEEGRLSDLDLVFLATKDPESMANAKEAFDQGVRVIDMSGAFRLGQKEFEQWYGLAHTCPELLAKAVYGMPQLYLEQIAAAQIVANPGCYPTSVILPLKPITSLIEGDASVVATSGNSGARKAVEDYDDEVTYSYGRLHKHVPEMEKYTGVRVDFTPIVLRSVFRGINTNIKVRIRPGVGVRDLEEAVRQFYRPEDLVFVVQDGNGKIWSTADVTNSHRLIVKIREDEGYAYINSLVDNLGKGAASVGIENMNIMLGLDRLEGISDIYSTKGIS